MRHLSYRNLRLLLIGTNQGVMICDFYCFYFYSWLVLGWLEWLNWLRVFDSGFADVFDVDFFIERTKGFVDIVKELPEEIAGKEPFRVDCSKRMGSFDYAEVVLPELLKHQFISITPAMSQRRDRYHTQHCYQHIFGWLFSTKIFMIKALNCVSP